MKQTPTKVPIPKYQIGNKVFMMDSHHVRETRITGILLAEPPQRHMIDKKPRPPFIAYTVDSIYQEIYPIECTTHHLDVFPYREEDLFPTKEDLLKSL